MNQMLESESGAAEAQLTDHNYDGIQEYDNPMPGWWVWLFVATVVYSVLYLLYFETGMPGRSIYDEYQDQQTAAAILRFGEIGDLRPNRETLLRFLFQEDPKWLAVGESFYSTNCVSCHGLRGEGGIGPNLTDDHYKSVRQIEDIATVIANGAGNGAMPAWGDRFSHPNILVLTAAYVASLRETNPPGGKAPEGNPIAPWPSQ